MEEAIARVAEARKKKAAFIIPGGYNYLSTEVMKMEERHTS